MSPFVFLFPAPRPLCLALNSPSHVPAPRSLTDEHSAEERVDADDDEYVDDDEDGEVYSGGAGKKRSKRPNRKKQRQELVSRERTQMRLVKDWNKIFDEVQQCHPAPNYFTAAAAPSRFPARHFCSVCGQLANYSCGRCGLRYCSIRCQNVHKDPWCIKQG